MQNRCQSLCVKNVFRGIILHTAEKLILRFKRLTGLLHCRVKCFSGGIGGHSKSKCIWIFININITNLSDKMVWFGEHMAGKQVANTKKTIHCIKCGVIVAAVGKRAWET